MIQKITQNNGNFWTVNLIMRAKIVNQSSDFPVLRTGSYRHKKALILSTVTRSYCDSRDSHKTSSWVLVHTANYTTIQQSDKPYNNESVFIIISLKYFS